jgi:hypothetical protein
MDSARDLRAFRPALLAVVELRMEDPRRPGSDRFYDPRAGRDRTALRIHPDGGGTGTAGCIGVVGDAATLRRFRDDMNAELRRNGGSYTLRVQ